MFKLIIRNWLIIILVSFEFYFNKNIEYLLNILLYATNPIRMKILESFDTKLDIEELNEAFNKY